MWREIPDAPPRRSCWASSASSSCSAVAWHFCFFQGCPDVHKLGAHVAGGAPVLLDRNGKEFADLAPVEGELVKLSSLPKHVRGSVHRRRGPALPRARRGGPAARRGRAVEQRALGRRRGGLEHDHHAARAERLPRRAARPEADAAAARSSRSASPTRSRASSPRTRSWRCTSTTSTSGTAPRGSRPRRGTTSARPAEQADPGPGRAARGAAQGPDPLRPAAAPEGGPRAPQPRAHPDAGPEARGCGGGGGGAEEPAGGRGPPAGAARGGAGRGLVRRGGAPRARGADRLRRLPRAHEDPHHARPGRAARGRGGAGAPAPGHRVRRARRLQRPALRGGDGCGRRADALPAGGGGGDRGRGRATSSPGWAAATSAIRTSTA